MSDINTKDTILNPYSLPCFSTNAILMISDIAFKIDKEGTEDDDANVPVWVVDNLVKK